MNRKRYCDILDSAAASALHREPDLWPEISASLERKNRMTAFRTRPIAALFLGLLILLVLSGAAYALGRAFGYIPGVGLVDTSDPLRILARPVSIEQQGRTITVTKVVADSTRTYISYRMDGIPLDEMGQTACATLPQLRLPDGSTLENLGGGDGIAVVRRGAAKFYDAEWVYAPLPAGSPVTFVLDCSIPNPAGLTRWEIPLELVSAPQGYTTPVVVITVEPASAAEPAATGAAPAAAVPSAIPSRPASTPATQALEAAVTSEPSQSQSGLRLEKVLEFEHAYILIGKFVAGNDLGGQLYLSTSSDSEYRPRIVDAGGSPVTYQVRQDLRPDPDWDVAYHWAYEIPKPVAAPLAILVERVNLRRYHNALLSLDTGRSPQAAQTWELGRSVRLGSSELVIESATFTGSGYSFTFTSTGLPAGVTPDIRILDKASTPFEFERIDSVQRLVGDRVRYTVTLTAGTTPPTGELTVEFGLEELIPRLGPWSLTWSPGGVNP